MSEPSAVVGLAGLGVYLPARMQSAAEIAELSGLSPERLAELGIAAKALPGPEDQPITMASQAARAALADAGGVDPASVDLVLWTGEEYKDYIAQTASIRLQEECGCRNAWAFDLVGQGITAVLGLKIAWDMMTADQSINTVLLAGGSRNIDLVDYANPDTHFLLAYSASGGAMLLRRGLEQNRLIAAVVETDPAMADEVYVPGGGTEMPFALDNLDSPLMRFTAFHPELHEALSGGAFVDSGWFAVTQSALAGQGGRITWPCATWPRPSGRRMYWSAWAWAPGSPCPWTSWATTAPTTPSSPWTWPAARGLLPAGGGGGPGRGRDRLYLRGGRATMGPLKSSMKGI